MSWRTRGAVATAFFSLLALFALRLPDAALPVLVYLGAAGTALAISLGRPVHRWITVVLVVLPAELALMTLVFEPDEQRALATSASGVLTRRAALESLGMLTVAFWAAWLALTRPHHRPDTPEL